MAFDEDKKKNKEKIDEVAKFKPEISENSRVLAEHYRQRMIEETNELLQTHNINVN